jgi:hypothetical protein
MQDGVSGLKLPLSLFKDNFKLHSFSVQPTIMV